MGDSGAHGAPPGSQEADPELRLILVGTIDCGKTLTADTLLGRGQTSCSPGSWRSCNLRQGHWHSRPLTLVEAPRWYWSGDRLESSVHEETRRALTLVGPGPHCILLLIPINQFTEMERRAAQQIEEVFGGGALRRTLVLLTCGDYLLGRPVEEYLARENQGLREVIGLCGGRYHVINNRRLEDREQVLQLLKKVDSMVQGKGGSLGQDTPQPSGSLSPGLVEQQVVMEKTRGVNTELPFTTARQTAEAEAAGIMQRMEAEEAESKRRENERLEKEREERMLQERLEAARVERERLEREAEEERLKAVQIEMESREKERREREQLLREEIEKKEKERAEAERKRIEREERLETERKRQERADRERAEKERLERERVEREKHQQERAEALRREREKAERDMLEHERRETERRENERLEKLNERLKQERLEKENRKDRIEKEMLERQQMEINKANRDTLEKEREHFQKEQERPNSGVRGEIDANACHSQMSPRNKESLEQPYTPEDKLRMTKGTSQPAAESAVLSKLSEAAGKGELKEIYRRIVAAGEDPSSLAPELRLVLLGSTKSGKSTAGNAILGRRDFQTQEGMTAVTRCCQKGRAILGNRRVAVVDTPDWFRSECTPDEVRSQLSSCVALSSPGPHAFLLCLPLHQPPPDAMQMLDAVQGVFGPRAVSAHTLLLFTHSDVLGSGNGEGWGTAEVEEHISKLPHLLKLVERCGDHYHILERDGKGSDGGVGRKEGGRDEEEARSSSSSRSVEELLEKVEQMVLESGGGHHSCQLYQDAESRVRQRQEEILQARRERKTEQSRRRRSRDMIGGESDRMVSSGQLVSLMEDTKGEEDEEGEEEEEDEVTALERAREEAEKSVTLDSVPALAFSKSASSKGSSLVRSAWEKAVQGVKSVPKPLMGGALVGCGLGAFLGGLLGGAVGATGGVALAEVARRKLQSKQTDGEGHIEGKKDS